MSTVSEGQRGADALRMPGAARPTISHPSSWAAACTHDGVEPQNLSAVWHIIKHMVIEEIASTIDRLRAAVDDLLAAPVDALAATDLASVIESIEVQRRRLEAVDQKLLATASA